MTRTGIILPSIVPDEIERLDRFKRGTAVPIVPVPGDAANENRPVLRAPPAPRPRL
jgi:hypothetical protein